MSLATYATKSSVSCEGKFQTVSVENVQNFPQKNKTHRIPTGGERYPGHVVLRNHVPRVHADQRQVLTRDGQRDVGAGVLHVRRVRYALEDAFVDAPFLRRFETSGFAYPVDAFPDKAKKK